MRIIVKGSKLTLSPLLQNLLWALRVQALADSGHLKIPNSPVSS